MSGKKKIKDNKIKEKQSINKISIKRHNNNSNNIQQIKNCWKTLYNIYT